MDKSRLRKSFLAQRNRLSFAEIQEKSRLIQYQLFNFPAYQQAKTIMFFVSFNKEVNTQDMIQKSLQNKQVIVPKILDDDSMIPMEIKNFDELTTGKYGILEPHSNTIFENYNNIDMITVPAVVFDKQGYRVGYGKGYYDVFLKKINTLYVGLCMDFQIVEHITHDKWDIPVHYVITEKQVYTVSY